MLAPPMGKDVMTFIKAIAASAGLGVLCGMALIPQVLAQAGGDVKISGFKFSPDTVNATANAAIKWTNDDGAPHQVVIASKNLKTPVLNKGPSAELKIDAGGSYDYVCGIHPNMKGKVVVK
jgi:plastocyanin